MDFTKIRNYLFRELQNENSVNLAIEQFILMQKPLSKILCNKNFWSSNFITNNFTMDPRGETEKIIELIIEQFDKNSQINFIDFGTGTGCLILSLLTVFPFSTAVAVDISIDAIEVAKINCKRLGLCKRISFVRSDWWEKIPSGDYFDVLVSNPPYLREDQIRGSLIYDPTIALLGDIDCYQKILSRLDFNNCFLEIPRYMYEKLKIPDIFIKKYTQDILCLSKKILMQTKT